LSPSPSLSRMRASPTHASAHTRRMSSRAADGRPSPPRGRAARCDRGAGTRGSKSPRARAVRRPEPAAAGRLHAWSSDPTAGTLPRPPGGLYVASCRRSLEASATPRGPARPPGFLPPLECAKPYRAMYSYPKIHAATGRLTLRE
jgi:hypothetical protein